MKISRQVAGRVRGQDAQPNGDKTATITIAVIIARVARIDLETARCESVMGGRALIGSSLPAVRVPDRALSAEQEAPAILSRFARLVVKRQLSPGAR